MTFEDIFSAFPAGTNTQDIPNGYSRVSGTGDWISYITGNPKHWLVSTGVAAGYTAAYQKDGFTLLNGFIEMDITTPSSGGSCSLMIGNGFTELNFVQLYYWGYGNSIRYYINGAPTNVSPSFPNENIRLRIDRAGNDFTFTVTRLSNNSVLHTSTHTVPSVSQTVLVQQAEVGYKINRLAGSSNVGDTVPTFNLKAKVARTAGNINSYTEAKTNWDISAELPVINLSNYAPLGETTNWNCVITGLIKPLYTENYTFSLESDDAGRLYIDDVQIGLEASSTTGTITTVVPLVANQIYRIEVTHNQYNPPEYLRLKWQSANQSLQFVPPISVGTTIPVLTLVSQTENSVTLQCLNTYKAAYYKWYRLIGLVWTLEATTQTDTVTISNLPTGQHQFKVQFEADLNNPTVNLSSSHTTVATPTLITLIATAADADSVIARVEFYEGSTLLGTDTSSPYTQNVNITAVGSRQFKARAFDVAGNSSDSNLIAVTYGSNALVTSGLLAEYKFDQGSGQNVLDSSGNNQTFLRGYDLTGADDPNWVAGGGIDMSNGGYLNRNLAGQFYSGNQDLTMVFVTSIPAIDGTFRFIYTQNPTMGGFGGYGSGIGFGKSGANSNLYLDFFGNTNHSAVPITRGQSFLVVTYAATSGEIKIYQNGTLLSTSNSSVAANINPNSADMFIGTGANIYWGAGTVWNQVVHYASFYNRVLTNAELTQMQNYCRALVAPRGVILP